MKKLLIILLMLIPIMVIGQQRTIRGDLTVKGRLLELPYGTINMADYYRSETPGFDWKYKTGNSNVILSSPYANTFSFTSDTVILSGNKSTFTWDYVWQFVNSEVDTLWDNIIGQYLSYRTNNIKTDKFSSHLLGSALLPSTNDTIRITSQEVVGITSYVNTSAATDRVEIGEQILLNLYGYYDDYMVVDSVIAVKIRLRDRGIDPDSIGSVYGIYNLDDGLRGADKTYFLYSEYGDVFIGGGGEIDQVGAFIKVGGDAGIYTSRTDATVKAGGVIVPHYTNAEEDFALLLGSSTELSNVVFYGGASADLNTATRHAFYAAANTTTTTGTNIVEITTDGLEILSGHFKQPTISASLTDGAPLDAELDSATGTTPSAAGAGASYIIIDSDGSGLTYKIMSDGTNWVYWTATIAL